MTEQETMFLSRLSTARDQDGLVDVKFFFHPSRAVKPGEIYEGLNEMEEAIENGNCIRHTSWLEDEPADIVA